MYAQSDGTITQRRRMADDTTARWFCTRTTPDAQSGEAPPEHVALGLGVLVRDPEGLRSVGRLASGASAACDRLGLQCFVSPDRALCQSGEDVTVAVVVANSRLTPCRATARLVFWQQTGGACRQLRSYILRLEMRAGAVYRALVRHTVTATDGAVLGATLSVHDDMEHLQTMDEAAFTAASAFPFASQARRAA